MKTGNTHLPGQGMVELDPPQWSPVMKTGNTRNRCHLFPGGRRPQWSPVMKTGNTANPRRVGDASESLNGARS